MKSSTSLKRIRLIMLISLAFIASGCLFVETALPDTFENISEVRRNNKNSAIALVKGDNLSRVLEAEQNYQSIWAAGAYGEMALAFVDKYREEFLLKDPLTELSITQVQNDDLGFHQVRLVQRYEDLEVLETELIVSFNREDHIYLVQGLYLPTPIHLSISPRLTEQGAKELLNTQLEQNTIINEGRLAIFPTEESIAKLAYQFQTRRGVIGGQYIITDANSGSILRSTPTSYQ